MGKKSKSKSEQERKKTKSYRSTSKSSGGSNSHSHSHSPAAAAATSLQQKVNVPTPDNGWARELRQAEKALKEHPDSEELIVRTARAYLIMRQFDKLRKLVRESSSESSSSSTNVSASASADASAIVSAEGLKQLNSWIIEADNAEAQMGFNSKMTPILEGIFRRDYPIDQSTVKDDTFGTLNYLQFAAANGDICLLERLVALGAALDYPANFDSDSDPNDNHDNPSSLKGRCNLPGTTALLVAMVGLVTRMAKLDHGDDDILEENETMDDVKRIYDGQLKVAIQLVWLGADFYSVRVQQPPPANNDSNMAKACENFDMVGKSAYELALLLGEEELLDAMSQLDTNEKKIQRVHCRCGSRLPWKDCHYSTNKHDSLYYCQGKDRDGDGDGNNLNWRYSPLAACPCKNTKKTYFRCCWEETFQVMYLDDSTGNCFDPSMMTLVKSNPKTKKVFNEYFAEAKLRMGYSSEEAMDRLLSVMTRTAGNYEDRTKICDYIRQKGTPLLEMNGFAHPKSRLGQWDVNVYAGTIERIERIDEWFLWDDAHWDIPKPELLSRTKAWNKALEQYCDDMGLDGPEREEVIQLHKANPLAPCANLACDKFEKKVKEFKICAHCRNVGYCSVACQREDWKRHKKECIRR